MSGGIVAALPAMHLVCNLVMSGVPQVQHQLNDSNSGLPGGYVAYSDIGTAYKYQAEIVSWFAAKDRCLQEGSNLAVIDSPLKVQLARRLTTSTDFIHVGIHIVSGYGNDWVSVKTGLPLSNLPWADGEPNGGGLCLVLKSDQPLGLGRYTCSTARPFICERPIPN